MSFFPQKHLNPGHTEDELGITNISLHQKKVCHPHFQVCSTKCEEDILFTQLQDQEYVINATWLRRHPLYSLNYIVVRFLSND